MAPHKEKPRKDSGFGLRLAFAIFMTIAVIPFLVCGAMFFVLAQSEHGGSDAFMVSYIFLGVMGFCALYAAVAYLAAFKGITKKWANKLIIALTAPLCFGLVGIIPVIGGAFGIRDINDPQRRERPKAPYTGFKPRLAQAILYVVFALCTALIQPARIVFPILLAVAVLQFVFTFTGKKSKASNIIGIAINAPFTLSGCLGLCGLLGCIFGYKYLKAQEPTAAEPQEKTEYAETVPEEAAAEPATAAELVPSEYIKPRLSPKAQKAMMITLIVSYSLLLIFGVLTVAVEGISPLFSGLGICDEIAARAYAITVGTMMLALTPSIGYYFAAVAPVELTKKKKAILATVSTALLLALTAVFYVVAYCANTDGIPVSAYFEGDDNWFVPLSMAFAALGIMICYALTLFHINPEKIATKKPAEAGNGLVSIVKHVFALLIYGILRLAKAILAFKEKQPEIFILLATILLTWLAFFTAFVFAIICIAVLVGVVIMCFTGVMSLASPYNDSFIRAEDVAAPVEEYTYTDSHGYTQTIYSNDGKTAYDVGGHYAGEIEDGNSDDKKKFYPAGTTSYEDED